MKLDPIARPAAGQIGPHNGEFPNFDRRSWIVVYVTTKSLSLGSITQFCQIK